MSDKSFLDWPFFEEHHRRHAAELEAFASRIAVPEHHDDASLDAACRTLVRALGEAGLLSQCCVPEPGGRFDVRGLALSRDAFARRDGLLDFAFAMQGLGSGPISLFGSAEQRKRYLPPVVRGEKIPAFALSEPQAGSDVGAIATRARRDGSGWVIDGTKTWISNAGIADHYVVFARTEEGARGAKGLSAFVVEAGTPGFEVTARIPVIAPHPLGTISFQGCRVPESALLGAPGEGFKIAMATLDVFRTTVGAAALGLARRALDEALARVRSREVFGKPLAEYQLTQARIADMAVAVDAAALLVYRAAWRKDASDARITREAAMAKLYATEAAQQVIDSAVQLFGGTGVVSGTPVERLYREIRALRIYEGTSEIQKLVIARTLV
ncbi:MAG: acyl-CoA dehydrogenase [Betaproteobacteria bacterium RIFCSPHIGHO2_12_FULL_69_13]|nr:MAG: acyl-CoA dehydrogenase [Betaproteobacteria bacterium RIFCSPHIGHO2_12_FULL_69_13]OGA69298.1 MAG: acyl-CoA dehydrogenase [Betaproteobacteria bacterium RIFCSPLOWO2_12_FULL_68_20]